MPENRTLHAHFADFSKRAGSGKGCGLPPLKSILVRIGIIGRKSNKTGRYRGLHSNLRVNIG
jgi:hypothetical protein